MDDAKFWLIMSQWPDRPSWPDDSLPACPRCLDTRLVGDPTFPVACGRCTTDYTTDVQSTGHDAGE
jgi:hypothetical protein